MRGSVVPYVCLLESLDDERTERGKGSTGFKLHILFIFYWSPSSRTRICCDKQKNVCRSISGLVQDTLKRAADSVIALGYKRQLMINVREYVA